MCTQVNNGLLIEDAAWLSSIARNGTILRMPRLPSSILPDSLPHWSARTTSSTISLIGGPKVTVWFTRTSDGRDMDALRKVITSAKDAILFLMFTPGKQGLHTLAGQRANEKDMYVRGVVSTLGNEKGDSDKNVLDIRLVSSDKKFIPDHYTVIAAAGNRLLWALDRGSHPPRLSVADWARDRALQGAGDRSAVGRSGGRDRKPQLLRAGEREERREPGDRSRSQKARHRVRRLCHSSPVKNCAILRNFV